MVVARAEVPVGCFRAEVRESSIEGRVCEEMEWRCLALSATQQTNVGTQVRAGCRAHTGVRRPHTEDRMLVTDNWCAQTADRRPHTGVRRLRAGD